MAAVGPLLGGWLTENHSWRWAFYINVPVVIVIVVGSLLVVPESKEPGGEAVAEAAGEAFATSIRLTAFTAAAFVFFGLLATLKLPPDGRHEDEELLAAPDDDPVRA